VTAAELIAVSAINAGKFAQSFPSFGPERRGAPVMAFARVSETRIRNRSAVYQPDIVIVLDPSLLCIIDVTVGLKKDGLVIINTHLKPEEIRKQHGIKSRLATVDALSIAMAILKRPITNTTLLGALNKATNLLDNKEFFHSIEERFGKIAEKNIAAFKEAFEKTSIIEAANG
jgi:pyruvate ferredoxin oxidoreductase gamma subunit